MKAKEAEIMAIERRKQPTATGIDLAEIAADSNDPADDLIPSIGVFRGVRLHDQQPPQRLRIVRTAIKRVCRLSRPEKLMAYLQDAANPPEARLLAAQRLEELVAQGRDRRKPPFADIAHARACVAGLDSRKWRDPVKYCSLLEADYQHAVRRERPLTDEWP
jgi:hypothetical protein